jgi:uncharacterized protein DUF6011
MLSPDFFHPLPMEPIPALAALRAVVLERTTKRMPKWQFRVADDITIQIQPKSSIKKLRRYGCPGGFECEAVEDPGDYLGTRKMNFYVFQSGRHLELGSDAHRVSRNDPEAEQHRYAVERRDRMIRFLPRVFATLRPEMMLSGGCLVCGRKLTDPISQARWIGPECNESAAALNPFLIRLREAAE